MSAPATHFPATSEALILSFGGGGRPVGSRHPSSVNQPHYWLRSKLSMFHISLLAVESIMNPVTSGRVAAIFRRR